MWNICSNVVMCRDQWKALLLLGRIVHRTLEATVVTWTSACAACAASGIWQHALTVQAVQDLNELTFDAAIRSCAVAQKLRLRRFRTVQNAINFYDRNHIHHKNNLFACRVTCLGDLGSWCFSDKVQTLLNLHMWVPCLSGNDWPAADLNQQGTLQEARNLPGAKWEEALCFLQARLVNVFVCVCKKLPMRAQFCSAVADHCI